MCMQDLAISRNLTVRQLPNVTDLASGGSAIPPNPNRVWLMAFATATGLPARVRFDPSGIGAVVNQWNEPAGSVQQVFPLIHIKDYPGIFNSPLYFSGAASAVVVYEAIEDSGLSAAVTRLSGEITDAQ